MSLTFNPLDASRKLRESGMAEATADATVEVIGEATSPLVTRDMLHTEFSQFRAEMYRALWIQGAGIVTINAAILATAIALVEVLRQG
ncbi:MAG: hypothetical protein OXS47_07830 [Chloroflexota bacterium]|nr:hypothetical protein [Chloroflexota bacterium]